MDGYAINGDVGSQAVLEVGTISFEGNIIPPTWFDHIKYPNGKPHLNAIVVLSEIVYWYRPMTVKDPVSLKVKEYRKKFKGEYLQLNRKELSEKFGITPKQATDALKKLEECEVIKKHLLKSLMTDSGKKLGNVPYVELVPSTLRNITHPYYLQDRGSVPQEGGLVPVGQTNTENTYTENTYRKTAAYTDPTPSNPLSAPDIAAAVLKDLETAQRQRGMEVQANETAILSAFQRFNKSIKEKGGGLTPITGTAKIARDLALRGETEATMKTAWDTCKTNGIKPMGAFMKWIQEGYLPPQQEGHETKVVDGVVSVWVEGQGWMEIGGKAQ